MTYEVIRNETNEIQIVVLNSSVFIPCDESNLDYQAFVQWCAEGNTPEDWSAE